MFPEQQLAPFDLSSEQQLRAKAASSLLTEQHPPICGLSSEQHSWREAATPLLPGQHPQSLALDCSSFSPAETQQPPPPPLQSTFGLEDIVSFTTHLTSWPADALQQSLISSVLPLLATTSAELTPQQTSFSADSGSLPCSASREQSFSAHNRAAMRRRHSSRTCCQHVCVSASCRARAQKYRYSLVAGSTLELT